MPKRAAAKRELEEPGDISVTRAPAAPKKTKAAPVVVAKKTCSATKQANSDNSNGQTMQTISKPDEDPVGSQSPPITTKAIQNKKPATTAEKAPQTPDDFAPVKPPPAATKGKKSSRPKQPSAIAEKANKQAVTKQNAKESQAAKKAKKAEAAVIKETPEETCPAQVKGQLQPLKTSVRLTSPKRPRPPINCEKALEQLLNAHAPSPNPGAAPLANTTTNSTTQINNAAANNSAPQASKPRPRPKVVTQPGLQVPCSTPPSWDVSPIAPPLLQIPSSKSASHEVSPSAESTATVDDDYDKDIDIGFDYKALLDGIPKSWNLGPVSTPPPLLEPLHTAKLKPEVLEKAANGGKEKPKVARPKVNNFCVQDQQHLKLALKYMDALVATICVFPDDDTRWTFATLSNYWASKKLGCNYRLNRQLDYCRLLYSRILQSRSRLVSALFSDGIRDNYDGLSWRPTTGSDKAQLAEAAIRTRVALLIKDGLFTAPANRPSAYYQNPWFAHILKLGYWQLATSKGMSEAHTKHFSSGISYPLMALVVTATEKMLAAVAAGPNSTKTSHKNAANAFSHACYAPRFHCHLLTLTKLHHSRGGPILKDYLTRIHKEFRTPFLASVPPSHTLQLAIPMSTLNDYGVEQHPAPRKESSSAPEALITRRPKVQTRSAASIDLGAILNDPALTSSQKVKLLDIIYERVEDDSSQTHSARMVQQYEGHWAGVNADSDNSKVEARRAGAVPDSSSNTKAGFKAWMSDSDEEEIKDAGKDEGDGRDSEESEGEGEVEGESAGEGDDEDKSEAEIADKEDPEAEESGGAVSTAENEGDTNKEYDGGVGESDVDLAPDKPHQRRFFTADGGLSSPAGSEYNDEAETDGKGTSGAVATQVDGDQMMMTAVASNNEDY